MTIALILFMNWIPRVLSRGSPVIPLLMDSVCVLYNAVNKSISCSHVSIPVGEGQANEELQVSFPAYYFLPPSVSSVTFYIHLLYSLTESHCILNFTHHAHGHHTIIIYGSATCMHAKHYYYYFTLVFHHHYNCYRRLLNSLFLSICLSPWNNLAPIGWIFMKLDI